MRCPRCRSEVGNQPVCPYCGGTVYMQNVTYSSNDVTRRSAPSTQGVGISSGNSKKIDRRLRHLETKLDLLLILAGGNLIFCLLLLIAIILK